MRAVLVLATAAAVLSGRAHADDPACAKFEEPLAYNACLAAHGPHAKDVGVSPEPATAPGFQRAGKPRAEGARRATRFPDVARGHGRVHIEFRIR